MRRGNQLSSTALAVGNTDRSSVPSASVDMALEGLEMVGHAKKYDAALWNDSHDESHSTYINLSCSELSFVVDLNPDWLVQVIWIQNFDDVRSRRDLADNKSSVISQETFNLAWKCKLGVNYVRLGTVMRLNKMLKLMMHVSITTYPH